MFLCHNGIIGLARAGQENYNVVMSAKGKAVFILVVMGAIGFGGSRSFVEAQPAAAPATPPAVVTQMLDEMAATGGSPRAAGMTARITAVSGAVKIRRVKALFWENAAAGREVAEGDSIKTGKDGQVKIAFADGNVLYIKKESLVIVEALSRDAKTKKVDAVFKTTKARLKAQIDNSGSLKKFEIRTPVVVCGVRGTVLYLNARPGFADVFVERGNVFLRSPVSGQERELPPGMATKADKSGNITEPEPPTPEELAEMQEGWEPEPPAEEGAVEPPGEQVVLADAAADSSTGTVDERAETQESAKTDYISKPPCVDGDFDADGISDNNDPDDDNDYLSDIDEIAHGTLIQGRDTDGDGLTDWEEIQLHGTDPLVPDTDSDPTTVLDLDDVDPIDNAINELRTNIRGDRYNKIATVAGLRAEITTMLADAVERQKDYIMDRISDAQRHKVLLDSSGNWVRLEQHIFRPAPNKIVVSALTYRTSAQLSIMHWETTFSGSLDGITSQEIRAMAWDAFLHTGPNYGLTAPAVYPTQMLVGFEWHGSPNKLEAQRVFGPPVFGTSWTQTVADSASFDGGAFLPGTYSLTQAGNSGILQPGTFQWDESAGPATFSVDVHIIDDTGALTGGVFSFNNLFDVLAVNLPGFVNIGANTIEMHVHFGAVNWEYLYLPLHSLTWRGTPQWEEELTW